MSPRSPLLTSSLVLSNSHLRPGPRGRPFEPFPNPPTLRLRTQDLAEWLCDQGEEVLKASSLVELSSRRQVLMEKLEAIRDGTTMDDDG